MPAPIAIQLYTVRDALAEDFAGVVEKIAAQDGYDIVLYRDEFEPILTDPEAVREQIRSRKVLYCSPRADITAIVLDKLNADYRAQPRTKMLDIP